MNAIHHPARLRTDNVGSMLRPPALLAARADHAAGRIDAQALRRIEDAAIAEVIRLQQEIGLSVATDGEFRREIWWYDFVAALRGVQIEDGKRAPVLSDQRSGDCADPSHDHASHDYAPKTVRTVGRISADGPITEADYRFVAAHAGSLVPKITIPSPTRLHFHGGRTVVSETAYPDMEMFFADLASLYQREIAALEAAGCRYIQIDDPVLSYFLSPQMREGVIAEGDDPDARLARYVQLINECIAHRAPETRIGLHICRGNARSLALSEGPYDGLAEACFNHLKVDRYLLEYDDARSGGFEPLRLIPRDREVVLGLVTTKRPELEDRDLLLRRIEEATRFVDADRLAISPQCGFASIVDGNAITMDDQAAKLRLVVDVAREVWPD
jgi:5-methyltetrahydropteroyltriglutamate--homocysteine methyltransferase